MNLFAGISIIQCMYWLNHFLCVVFLSAFASCSPRSQEDYHREGQRMMRYLLRELEMVRSHQEFAHASARVSKLFCELADLMIVAREYRYENPGQEPQEIDEKARALNRQLEKEIKRIRALAGGDHWLERCQEEAALRLAAFEARKASL